MAALSHMAWRLAAMTVLCVCVLSPGTLAGTLYNSRTFDLINPNFLLPKPAICKNLWWTGVYMMDIYQHSPEKSAYYANHDCDLHILISDKDYFMTNISVLDAHLLANQDGSCADYVQLFQDAAMTIPLTQKLCEGKSLPKPFMINSSGFTIYTKTGEESQPMRGWHIHYSNVYDFTGSEGGGSSGSGSSGSSTSGQHRPSPAEWSWALVAWMTLYLLTCTSTSVS